MRPTKLTKAPIVIKSKKGENQLNAESSNGDSVANESAKPTNPQNQLQDIEHLEASLWDAADNLRANSKLTANEYCMPVLGVIFLRHATNRYNAALREIEVDQAVG